MKKALALKLEQPLVEFSLEPKSLEEAMKFAEIIANSDFAPKDYKGKPGNVLIAVQMGKELGLKPMQALQNISIINGRPCVWGDAPLGLVRSSGLLEDFREEFNVTTMTATTYSKRKRIPTPIITSYSMEDAKKAGLWNKAGSWQTDPKRMILYRSRAFNLRDGFSDVLKGLWSAEEQEDIAYLKAREATVVLDVPTATSVALPNALTIPTPKKNGAVSESTATAADSLTPLQEWIDSLEKAEDLEALKTLWSRVCPPSKDGLYHAASLEDQAKLLAAKNARKQVLDTAQAACNAAFACK